jgi:Putative bacterial sensory transduction regulator
MALRGVLLAFVLLCLADQAAIARPLPDGGITAQEMSEVLKAGGYPVEMASFDGRPVINTSVNGIKFGIFFLECDPDGRCQSILFSASWSIPSITQARMQDWNRTKRFGRGYLSEQGTPFVEMDMDFHHGATTEALVSNLDRWKLVVKEFPTYFRR